MSVYRVFDQALVRAIIIHYISDRKKFIPKGVILMKKITAFLLCLSVVSGMCAPAYALEPLYTKEEYEKIIAEQGSDVQEKGADSKNTVTTGEYTAAAGDIDEDGDTDVTDLTFLALYLLGDMNFSEAQKKSADTDGDGDVTLADLAKYRQFLSKKIPYLTEPEKSSDPAATPSPDDKPAEPSYEPVTPMSPQPTAAADTEWVKKMIKSGDVSIYDEEHRQKYKDVYDRLTGDGYIIEPLESAGEDGIKFAEDRDVSLLPYGTYGDMGVLYNMEYKGNNYSVSVHLIDPQYKGKFSSMAEYYELRMGSMDRFEKTDSKTITVHSPLRDIDNGTEIISFSLLNYTDREHYCRVRTTASDEDYAEFMEKLQLKRNYFSTPLLIIQNDNEKGDKIYTLIDEDGYRYSTGVIVFGPLQDSNVLLKDDWFSFIIDYSREKELLIKEKSFLRAISGISGWTSEKNIRTVKDTGIRSANKSELSVNIICNDKTGRAVTPALLSRTDGKYFIAEDDETQILADSKVVTLVRYLVGDGLIDEEFLKAVDSIEPPEEEYTELEYVIQ